MNNMQEFGPLRFRKEASPVADLFVYLWTFWTTTTRHATWFSIISATLKTGE